MLRPKTLLKIMLLMLVLAVALLAAGLELNHRRLYGHFVGYGLHVDALARDAHIGIPGQTKMYYAQLSNFTLFPVRLAVCDFIGDDFGEGTEFPHAVQRWDGQINSWKTIAVLSACRPAPLSRIKADIAQKRLWPGQTVVATEGEATAAREPFAKGDRARFLIFRDFSEGPDWSTAIPSGPFQIQDQVVRDGGAFRIKH